MATSYPIILAHGICPMDRIVIPFLGRQNRDNDRFNYFRNIRTGLLEAGFTTFHGRVSWAAELERRARDLKDELVRITDYFSRWQRVHIIAHSMGGLDCRWMVYRYRMERHIASLTTIGTPHLGTSFAAHRIKQFGWLIPLCGFLGLNIKGFRDLTPAACQGLNQQIGDFEDHNGVVYQTVAGVQPLERIWFFMRPSHKIIQDAEGENDGLVSRRSAMWRRRYFLKTVDADHFNQIGWWNRSEARAGRDRNTFEKGIRELYVDIAKGLQD